MMTQTGLAGPFQLDDELEWDERNGYRRVVVFQGSESEIAGLIPTYAVAGYQFSRRKMGVGLFQLRVSAANAMDGSPTDTDAAVSVDWELDNSGIDISIYKRMQQRGVPVALVSYIQAKVETAKVSTDPDYAAEVAQVRAEATLQSYDEDDAEDWLDLIISGTEVHRQSNPLVRSTISAPAEWTTSASINIGKLYTKTQLNAAFTGVFTIPARILADMTSTGYYLREPVRIRTMGNGKIQVVSEFIHGDAFSALQYDLVT